MAVVASSSVPKPCRPFGRHGCDDFDAFDDRQATRGVKSWGIGKNWSKGLTKATDARVARAAAAHVGLQYVRRTPIEECRWPVRQRRRVGPPLWSPRLAYAVGLIATDGCLSASRRHIFFGSKDLELIETFLACIESGARPRLQSGYKGRYYRAEISDVGLYRWLLSAGLTPRKSLTLAQINVPDPFIFDLVRGLLDGDGSILDTTVTPNRRLYPEHHYRRLNAVFVSASRAHLDWLRGALQRVLGVSGAILTAAPPGRNPIHKLKFGKHASLRLLAALYADPDAPRLERKWRVWRDYCCDRPTTRMWSRRSGGMVLRGGLKIRWASAHEGSNPSSGTVT